MEYALRHLDYTAALFFHLAFPLFSPPPSYAAIPQSRGRNTVTVLSLFPPSLPLSLHLYHSLTLPSPSMGLALAPSLRLRQGVSE